MSLYRRYIYIYIAVFKTKHKKKKKLIFIRNRGRIKELCFQYYAIGLRIHRLYRYVSYYLYIMYVWTNKIKNIRVHTPNAEYRLVRLWLAWLRNTSDLGLGGFFGLSMTRVSSHISSSNNFESDDTDNCRLTRWSWLSRPELQSERKQHEY